MNKIAQRDEVYAKGLLARLDKRELNADEKIKAARLLEDLAKTPAERRRAQMLLKLLEQK
jgi:hypothetical protein